ncbi:hypothetical protein QUA08_17010 [Microcoleus sp. T3B2]|uniref:hypothetical protein n=1 Tax=Microcoleus sp. T3B2 TaxID=3055426 RepID=UPI002FD1B078
MLRQLYFTFSPIVGLSIARRKENGRQSANYYWYLMGLVFRLTLFKHLYLSFLVALNTTREPQPTRTPCDSRGAECGFKDLRNVGSTAIGHPAALQSKPKMICNFPLFLSRE